MPFQPLGSVNVALWRFQSTDPISGIIIDNYINLSGIAKMKFNRADITDPNSSHSQVKVWFWFGIDHLDNRDPDLTLNGSEAVSFINDIDNIFT